MSSDDTSSDPDYNSVYRAGVGQSGRPLGPQGIGRGLFFNNPQSYWRPPTRYGDPRSAAIPVSLPQSRPSVPSHTLRPTTHTQVAQPLHQPIQPVVGPTLSAQPLPQSSIRPHQASTQIQGPSQPQIPTLRPPPSPTAPQPTFQYLNYLDKKAQQLSGHRFAYTGYDPLAPPGPHQPFGEPVVVGGKPKMKYPRPTPSQLGDSATDYGFEHRSEDRLPRVKGSKAVYGSHQGLPIQGPADYHHYYPDWRIGTQYEKDIPAGKPLPDDELQFIEKYGLKFDRHLGSGGFGSVWLVKTTRLYKMNGQYVDRDVACKVLSLKTFKRLPETMHFATERLLRESLVHQHLDHQNIVRCGNVFHIHDPETGFPYCRCLIFMELCDGDLKSLFTSRPNGKFTEKECFEMFDDVSRGLQYLHDQNVVHLDLKVGNILYVKEGNHITYKLADFGISRRFAEGEVPEMTGTRGTPAYMAPEMTSSWGTPGAKNNAKIMDVYSCGLILAECLAGKGKFDVIVAELQIYDQSVAQKWQIGQSCRDLLVAMTADDPINRPTIQAVRQSQWFADNQPPTGFSNPYYQP